MHILEKYIVASVLYFVIQYWSCLQHSPGDPWPEGRSNHIAVCLGYGGQHKKLLISGGLNGPKVLSDTWLLDPLLSEWKEVRWHRVFSKLI